MIKEMLKKIPLETRVEIAITAFFIDKYGGTLFTPLDKYGNEIPEAVEINEKIMKKARPIIKEVLQEIKEWKEDGQPE